MKVKIGCHTFRATGITAYLEAGGTLENAQAMAAHESPRTTKLYDRTGDEITLDEVERIAIRARGLKWRRTWLRANRRQVISHRQLSTQSGRSSARFERTLRLLVCLYLSAVKVSEYVGHN